MGGGYLIVSSSFGIQEGRNHSPGGAWRRDSLSKVWEKRGLTLSIKCGLWDGNSFGTWGYSPVACGRGFAF